MDANEATIFGDDSYCETVAQFKDALRSGATPTDGAKSVWAGCSSAPDYASLDNSRRIGDLPQNTSRSW